LTGLTGFFRIYRIGERRDFLTGFTGLDSSIIPMFHHSIIIGGRLGRRHSQKIRNFHGVEKVFHSVEKSFHSVDNFFHAVEKSAKKFPWRGSSGFFTTEDTEGRRGRAGGEL
jgi:hypothetical protein